MKHDDFVKGLLKFIQNSPTPFHAVQSMVEILEQAGFTRLSEKEAWQTDQQQGS